MDKSIIAYFESSHDFPEEVVIAAKMTPYKILGEVRKPSETADQYLFKTFCPLARSILEEAFDESDQWAGIIVAHGCDATNRQYDIWKHHITTPFLYWFNTPMNDRKSAKKFFKEELKALVKALEEKFDLEITLDSIKRAIRLSNEIKSVLKELSNLRALKDISNSEYFETVKRAMLCDRTKALEELINTIPRWQSKPEFPSDKRRIVLTGSDITYREFMDILDRAGLRVVRDDLSIGERYFATQIPNKEDPLESLVLYHFNKPRPSTKHHANPRLDYLESIVNETKVDGIVSQNLKFCEPFAYDSVWIVNSFKEKGIPIIHLERDYTSKADHQLINRLEAFNEML
ncbi:MAG: hypothetical protein GF364_05095 [Candidatus Lokiarchaeota archaeon]|nr:hypothetical protein [Candidatus Lokiarchaeota archaeon]